MTLIYFLQDRGIGSYRNGFAAVGCETETKQELLVFLVELQNLENARPGLVQSRAKVCAVGTVPRDRPKGREGFVQSGEQPFFSLLDALIWNSPMLLKKTVLLESQLVQFVTEILVLLESLHGRHGKGR